MRALPPSFYARPTLQVARALLGQHLVLGEKVGRIVETEGYVGPHDLACHSSKGRTARTEVMFGPPGRSYVFLVYGMHFCFNVTTGKGAAVLIRALEPVANLSRRADGPGRLTAALGITVAHNGLALNGPELWLAEGTPPSRVARGPRIGVDYAREWAAKPYRYWERDNPHVSG
ncbi:MAG: DNA-3-methyladenine glycosylase [Archangiaceae bacterium]|nr:DNA-3-methyladenine glycosylase [Archangiaceae bacterium]